MIKIKPLNLISIDTPNNAQHNTLREDITCVFNNNTMNKVQNISGVYVFSRMFASDIMSYIAQFVYVKRNLVLLSTKYGGNMSTNDYHLLRYQRLMYYNFKSILWSKGLSEKYESIEKAKSQIIALKKMCKQKINEKKYVNQLYNASVINGEIFRDRNMFLDSCLSDLENKLRRTKFNLTKDVKKAKQMHKPIRTSLRRYRTSKNKLGYAWKDRFIMHYCHRLNIDSAALKKCYHNILIESLRKRYEASL